MSSLSLTLPTIGQPNSTEDSKVRTALSDIQTWANGGIDKSNLSSTGQSLLVPTGVIMAWPTATAPTGWLLCDGSAVSRTTYDDLFTLISEDYGAGDSSTTFNVPDLTGNVVVGYDSGDTNFDTLGETGGAATVTLTTAQMPAHTHGSSNGLAFLTQAAGTLVGNGASYAAIQPSTAATASAGSGGSHTNLQPYITLNYIIKT